MKLKPPSGALCLVLLGCAIVEALVVTPIDRLIELCRQINQALKECDERERQRVARLSPEEREAHMTAVALDHWRRDDSWL